MQIIGRRDGTPAIIVRSQEADIEIVAWEIEDRRIAAELRDREFGCEDEPNIRVAPVVIEIVNGAAEERHDFALHGGILTAVTNRERARGFECRGIGLPVRHGKPGGERLRYVLDAYELIDLRISAASFVARALGRKTEFDVIGLRGRSERDAIGHAVMARHDEPVR